MRAFDLDHTLITSNISFDFGLYLYRRGIISLFNLIALMSWYLRHKLLGLGIEELHKAAFRRLFKGVSLDMIKTEVELFLKEKPPTLNYPAISYLEPDSVLLSSSPDFLVGPICKMLNIQYYKASSYAVDPSGCLNRIHEVIEGEEKAVELKLIAKMRGVKKEEITYFTDSIWDKPVFEVVGKTIAVCPDRKLKKLALENQWEILGERTLSCSKRS